MAKIYLRSNLPLGCDEIEIKGAHATLRQVLSELMLKDTAAPRLIDPETGELSKLFIISVNRKNYGSLPDGLNTVLKDKDSVEIALAMFAGG